MGCHVRCNGLAVTSYDIPVGCVAGYFLNASAGAAVDHAEGSQVPAPSRYPRAAQTEVGTPADNSGPATSETVFLRDMQRNEAARR